MLNHFINPKYRKLQYLIGETKKLSRIYSKYSNQELKDQTQKLKTVKCFLN